MLGRLLSHLPALGSPREGTEPKSPQPPAEQDGQDSHCVLPPTATVMGPLRVAGGATCQGQTYVENRKEFARERLKPEVTPYDGSPTGNEGSPRLLRWLT